MRPPYVAYLQGALTYGDGKLALRHALNTMAAQGLLDINP
jgi:cystathionine beta-lyase family protein involved in aluminum resistance